MASRRPTPTSRSTTRVSARARGIEQFTSARPSTSAPPTPSMKAEELAAAEAARRGAKVLHIPTVFGAIVLAYNLPGAR